MKFAFETIVWGPHLDDLDATLQAIAEAGYQGVEFTQSPDRLGDIGKLRRLLDKNGIESFSLAGGSLLERIKFCQDIRPEYLVIYNWHEHAPIALEKGFTLALHPHLFHPQHRANEAMQLLHEQPSLKFLPDTALMVIAGDDPVTAVRDCLQMKGNRLLGVHLKDWSRAYGRAPHRYARGFTELGTGHVPLEAVLEELQAAQFRGWIVVEQDNSVHGPQECLRRCTQWLIKRKLLAVRPLSSRQSPNDKLLPDAERDEKRKEPSLKKGQNQGTCSHDPTPLQQLRFLDAVVRGASQELGSCYQTIAVAFRELLDCHLVTLWMCDSANNVLTLLAANPHAMRPIEPIHPFDETLTKIAIERQAPTVFNLTVPEPGAAYGYPGLRFSHPQLLQRCQLRQMISLPVLSTINPHHARLVLNFFAADPTRIPDGESLLRWGEQIAIAADAALRDECATAAALTNHMAGKGGSSSSFSKRLIEVISQTLNCDYASLFIVDERGDAASNAASNEPGDHLVLAATTGIAWRIPDEHFYRKGEGLTGRVWERKEAWLTTNVETAKSWGGKSYELIKEEQDSFLCAPIFAPSGKVYGVVRCHNKRSSQPDGYNMFTQDDVALIDAIGEAAVPHLQTLVNEERRVSALVKTSHELKNPLVAIRSATDIIQQELTQRGIKPETFFEFDYLGDILSWSELMQRLIENLAFHRADSASGEKPLKPERVLLLRDIIAPTVRQMKQLVLNRGFSLQSIQYGHFDEIPSLWLDKNQFQQVIFNLLANAIKYAYRDPAAFAVKINGGQTADSFVICVRDWGAGIKSGWEEAAFQEGVRAPNAVEQNVEGDGIGLWIVRHIVSKHGGTVKITNNLLPTEVTILLPLWLEKEPPPKRPIQPR